MKTKSKNLLPPSTLSAHLGTSTQRDIMLASDNLRAGLERLDAELRQLTTTQNQSTSASQSLWDIIGRGAVYLQSITALAAQFGTALKSLAEPALEMQKLDAMFKAASGNASLAAMDMQFVKNTVKELGLEFVSTAKAYASFAAKGDEAQYEVWR